MYPKMTERDVLDVVEAVRKLVAAYRLPSESLQGTAEFATDAVAVPA
jgi:hypothetical protein